MNPTAEGKDDVEPFVRRRAAARHHRRSRRARTVTVDILWALLLLGAALFVIGGIVAGFRPA